MGSESSTIQSLKAVDAWIDVINSNINGGVRTAFKSSRLKFGGTNVNVSRTGTSTSLPLQFPETGLMTSNTIIDFSQGAITASTENTHLAVQGTGFFTVIDPGSLNTASGQVNAFTANTRMYLTRDGEFRTNQAGFLVNSNGYYLVSAGNVSATGQFFATNMHAVYNNMDNPAAVVTVTAGIKLSDFVANTWTAATTYADNATATNMTVLSSAICKVNLGQQSLQYTQFGSTVFDVGFLTTGFTSAQIQCRIATSTDATLLNKSLEASNASMTQSVPELSLAQKLFSALTKVLQITQTNTDAVLNLVR